ncbi:hypothetical protein [Dyadobacter sandarakinus]|uniref:DUF3324 domain-containing protein n=1 Tax=Dyadobacter sandarakinus TaxID=2747268 RepID=A0ABX7I4A3_9BACT|nr:hypothetical protein [Dyadobacter sandarakinus]QRQ99870.1 hypothetical protein HWI92_02520 [Dyadobacter sandarakinus]
MKAVIRFILLLFLPGTLQASVVILNGLTHVHQVATANARVQGTIRVRNENAREARILIYRQDLLAACGGVAEYPEAGSHPRSLGNALKTNVDERIVGANEEYEITYTAQLDPHKVSTGTYWQVVMIEVAEPVKEQPRAGIQVNSKVRYAIQVVVDVGTYEGPRLSYENVVFDKVTSKQGLLKVMLKNNGSFASRANVVLEVYDTSGNKLKTTEPNTRMVYPGYCSTYEIPVSDLSKGKYDCVIIADTGKDLFGSNIALQIE